MSLTREESKLIAERETILSYNEREAVDSVFTLLFAELKDWKVTTAKDDRCAKLEAAFIKFIIDSRK